MPTPTQFAQTGWKQGEDAIPYLQQYMQGKNPYGTSGFNVENAFAQASTGGEVDERLKNYGLTKVGEHEEGGGRWELQGDKTGIRDIDGKRYTQVGEFLDKVIDPNKVFYDEEYGLMASPDNINNPERALDKYMPYIVAAGLGIPTAMHALGAGALAGGAAGGELVGGAMPEALGGAGGVTQYPVGSVGGMGGSGFGSTVGEFAQGIRNSIPDFSNPFNSSPGGGGSGASGAGGTSGGNMFDPVNALNSGGGNVPSGSGSWMNIARRMPWGDIIRGAGNIIGGNSQGSMNEAGERERQYNEQMWMRALMANSPNQTTDFGTSTWEVDPVTGRRSQTLRMNERDAARLGQFRDIASGRMNDAGKLLQLDWNKINPQVAQMMQGVSFGGNQLRGG